MTRINGKSLRFCKNYLHCPEVQFFTPAHFASQAFPYVFPSQPQTGIYSFVQIQSAMAVPLQPDIFLVHDEEIILKSIKADNRNFI
jgi:hypothetical protein